MGMDLTIISHSWASCSGEAHGVAKASKFYSQEHLCVLHAQICGPTCMWTMHASAMCPCTSCLCVHAWLQ